jgi:hypothetical protein
VSSNVETSDGADTSTLRASWGYITAYPTFASEAGSQEVQAGSQEVEAGEEDLDMSESESAQEDAGADSNRGTFISSALSTSTASETQSARSTVGDSVERERRRSLSTANMVAKRRDSDIMAL